MNLKELKAMIKEEWEAHQNEQALPSVAVSDADVDATGGDDENAEETLRDIFNMLKDYFEGGDDAPADDAPADDADDDDDEIEEGMHDEDDKNEGKKDKEDIQERFKKLANIIKG